MHAAYAYTLADPVSFTSTRERSGVERERVAERERERERDLINSFHSTANLGADKKKTLKSQGKKPSTLKSQYADSKNQ